MHVFVSRWYIHSSGITGSQGNSLLHTPRTAARSPKRLHLFVYVLSPNGRGFQFLRIITHICSHLSFSFSIIAAHTDVKCYPILVWICLSLVTNDIECLFGMFIGHLFACFGETSI